MLAALQERYAGALDASLRELLDDALPTDTPQLDTMVRYPLGLVDALGQSTSGAGGKRIRPMLLLLCNEAAGGDWRQALPAAVAVELLHNFSLVHDDIQDDSPMRRGRATVWRVWGRSHAINAGDLLLTLAFTALNGLRATSLAAETQLAVRDALVSSCLELTRGQHLDMHFESCDTVSVDSYLSMIKGKSAALIAACARIGALIACADDLRVERLANYGLNLGLTFQIRDDMLGIWGDPAVTGKSAATDIRSRKKSLPVLYGLERSATLARLYSHESGGEEDVQEVISILESLGARGYAHEQEARWARAAQDALEAAAPAGEAGLRLRSFTEALLQRNF